MVINGDISHVESNDQGQVLDHQNLMCKQCQFLEYEEKHLNIGKHLKDRDAPHNLYIYNTYIYK